MVVLKIHLKNDMLAQRLQLFLHIKSPSLNNWVWSNKYIFFLIGYFVVHCEIFSHPGTHTYSIFLLVSWFLHIFQKCFWFFFLRIYPMLEFYSHAHWYRCPCVIITHFIFYPFRFFFSFSIFLLRRVFHSFQSFASQMQGMHMAVGSFHSNTCYGQSSFYSVPQIHFCYGLPVSHHIAKSALVSSACFPAIPNDLWNKPPNVRFISLSWVMLT